MATTGDLSAATRDPRNHDLYRDQCELEISSTFAFRANKWLSDIAPEILSAKSAQTLAPSENKSCETRGNRKRHPETFAVRQGLANRDTYI
jgi:hypothetical protein